MATFTASDAGVDMYAAGLKGIVSIAISEDATEAVVTLDWPTGDPYTLRYRGHGLTALDLQPRGGTFTSVEYIRNGETVGLLEGLPASSFGSASRLLSTLTGSDILKGGAGSDFLYASSGLTDVFSGGGGDDTFSVFLPRQSGYITPSYTFEGAAGSFDTILINYDTATSPVGATQIDLRQSTFVDIENLSFGNVTDVILNASQFGPGKIARDGDFQANTRTTFVIKMDDGTSFNLGHLRDGRSFPATLNIFRIEGTDADETIGGTNTTNQDQIYGFGGDGRLFGFAGSDRLYGGMGADWIFGGDDNDQLWGEDGNDRLEGGRGSDVLYGGNGNDILRGGAGNDVMEGGDGSDFLNGGTAADMMNGGAGDDIYIVDNQHDVVKEDDLNVLTGGYDRVYSSVSYVLKGGVEHLKLFGDEAIDGTGNDQDNTIVGNVAANKLYGQGGNDTLFGFDGDDTLYGGAGNDFLAGGGGADLVDGGDGSNRLIGGAGDDIYVVRSASDFVREAGADVASGGNDTVRAFVTHTLGANVENLELQGGAPLDGVGNTLSNVMFGNDATNNLYGGGGDDVLVGMAGDDLIDGGAGGDVLFGLWGRDTLTGGAGADAFVFDFSVLTNGVPVADRITDFQAGVDAIVLEAVAFGLTEGPLPDSVFYAGTRAHDASDRIIYNQAAGTLNYDFDGAGGYDAITIATLDGAPKLTAKDIFVVLG